MNDVKAKSEACWGEDGLVCPAENKDVIKERALRAIVSSFILNSVTKARIDNLDLHRDDH